MKNVTYIAILYTYIKKTKSKS